MLERLKTALDERFDDIEECKDIQEHGCASCAPSGFIYYYENRKFFNATYFAQNAQILYPHYIN